MKRSNSPSMNNKWLHGFLFSLPVTYIYEMASNCCCCCHDRAYKVGTSTSSLTSFKITIACGGTTLSHREAITIHSDTHATACLTPLEACFTKDISQAFFLCRT